MYPVTLEIHPQGISIFCDYESLWARVILPRTHRVRFIQPWDEFVFERYDAPNRFRAQQMRFDTPRRFRTQQVCKDAPRLFRAQQMCYDDPSRFRERQQYTITLDTQTSQRDHPYPSTWWWQSRQPPPHQPDGKGINFNTDDNETQQGWKTQPVSSPMLVTHVIPDKTATCGGFPCNNTHSFLFKNHELRLRQACSWHGPWIPLDYGEDIEEHGDEDFLCVLFF
jgi:hypothetical protein